MVKTQFLFKLNTQDYCLIYKNYIILRINNHLKILLLSNLCYFKINLCLFYHTFYFQNFKIATNLLKLLQKLYFGIHYGFICKFILNGIGFKCGYIRNLNYIWFILGYSHRIMVKVPNNIKISYQKKMIIFSSYNLQLLSKFLLVIEQLRLPDIYRGKGLKRENHIIQLKIGKQR